MYQYYYLGYHMELSRAQVLRNVTINLEKRQVLGHQSIQPISKTHLSPSGFDVDEAAPTQSCHTQPPS